MRGDAVKQGNRKLTHLDAAGQPTMVDVAAKPVSVRSALAASRVRFPAAVAEALRGQGMASAKGPVLDTAIIAGTLAVKRTHELIPFCHPLPIDGCKFTLDWLDARTLGIRCQVRSTHRTGVEMEALTGVSVAALTVYDMCKALSHAIVIGPTRLLGKRGGKRDVGEID
ncbi:MAG: cyclic pyranopterin monophosphate synthase MoaC [Proteobacteria bacterium]|nr:cyclic pyranopterin monophosphate synthase MoaC [Pseudomonadota bacterium]